MFQSINDAPCIVRLDGDNGPISYKTIRFEWQDQNCSFRINGPALIVLDLLTKQVENYYSVSDRDEWDTFEEWINHPLVINHKMNLILTLDN